MFSEDTLNFVSQKFGQKFFPANLRQTASTFIKDTDKMLNTKCHNRRDWHRDREATMYLPASGGEGARVDSRVSISKLSIKASSNQGSRRCLQALIAVGGGKSRLPRHGRTTLP